MMERRFKTPVDANAVEEEVKPIVIVSCNGSDGKLVECLRKYENDLANTNSFKNTVKPLFQYVKKTGANVGSKLSVLKSIALGSKKGYTVPCRQHRNCKCCKLVKGVSVENINGHKITTAPGNCKSKNLIYLVSCLLCDKSYIGRTVQPLHNRMSGHRECFYKILRNDDEVDESKDDYSLGLHLANEHSCVNRTDFDELYNVSILENCSPADLDKKEHIYIHRFSTLYPLGLNKVNPFGLPLISV